MARECSRYGKSCRTVGYEMPKDLFEAFSTWRESSGKSIKRGSAEAVALLIDVAELGLEGELRGMIESISHEEGRTPWIEKAS